MILRIRIFLAHREAKAMSKHSIDRNVQFNATIKGWNTPVGSYKRGKRIK